MALFDQLLASNWTKLTEAYVQRAEKKPPTGFKLQCEDMYYAYMKGARRTKAGVYICHCSFQANMCSGLVWEKWPN